MNIDNIVSNFATASNAMTALVAAHSDESRPFGNEALDECRKVVREHQALEILQRALRVVSDAASVEHSCFQSHVNLAKLRAVSVRAADAEPATEPA